MIRYLLIAAILFSSCTQKVDNKIADFNKMLGHQESTSLDKLTTSFEEYLLELYPEKQDFQGRFCELLSELTQNDFQPNEKLIIPDSLAKGLIAEFENSGLSEELMIRSYDSLESVFYYEFNLEGAYQKALCEFANNNFIARYLKARENGGDMSLPILVEAFAIGCDNETFANAINKRIAAMEIYIKIAYRSVD